jgi:hypothetical protein
MKSVLGILTAAVLVASCSTVPTSTSTVSTSSTTETGTADASGTVWLCRPGLVADPCTANLTATVVHADGKKIGPHAAAIAYLGLLASSKDYLAHDNHGRGVVLIGHSQGAALPIPLIRHEIDPNPSDLHPRVVH